MFFGNNIQMVQKVLLCSDDSAILCNFLCEKGYPTLYHNKKQNSRKNKFFLFFLIPYHILNDTLLNGI